VERSLAVLTPSRHRRRVSVLILACVIGGLGAFGESVAETQTDPTAIVPPSIPSTPSTASTTSDTVPSNEAAGEAGMELDTTLVTLASLIELQQQLRVDIRDSNTELAATETEAEREAIRARVEALNDDLRSTQTNFTEIATGADTSILQEVQEPPFNFQEEFFSLLEPIIKELKGLTSHVRTKTGLRDKIAYFGERIPVVHTAMHNLTGLLDRTDDPALRENLQVMHDEWEKHLTFMLSQQQSAELQLSQLESAEVSISEASQSYFKTFFQNRGLYLGQALVVVLVILVIARLLYRLMGRVIPGYRKQLRSFEIRLLDLLFRAACVIALIVGPMVVFYLAEDWLLFSLGILLLLGAALTLREAIPRFWRQIQLFLNVGTVREGERVELDGLPWRVQQINLFSTFENPTADMQLRVKIDDLVDMRSRPHERAEPWFPCKKGDWVKLPDDSRARVIGISPELVQLVERGGAVRTYPTTDFLLLGVVNLSTNFRIKETIGVSYDLIRISTTQVVSQLQIDVEQRIRDEGYGDELLNLRVEFERANSSSLDVVVIADFDGKLAEIYNRLRRSIQRWLVDSCTEHGWEIPFNQVTVHQAAASTGS